MNLNKGCIEIQWPAIYNAVACQMNLNKGCIEMVRPGEDKKCID